MPWTLVGNCVHKKNADGSAGERVKCHDNPAQAQAHMKALYANVPEGGAMAHESARTGYFAERVELLQEGLDEEARKVRVTLIRPGWSQNGRYYAPEVLNKAAGLFEGTKAYRNHPSKTELKERPERSVDDLVGWYEGVKAEADGRITADLFVEDDSMWNKVRTAVTKRPDYIGLSINALGTTRRGEVDGKTGVIVEGIVKANSTDVVTTPAAGGSLDQLMQSSGDDWTRDLLEAMPLNELTETLREVRPDLLTAWQKEWKQPRDSKALVSARESAAAEKQRADKLADEHRATLQSLEEAQKRILTLENEAVIDRLMAGKAFPAAWRESIRQELLSASREQWDAILEREEGKARALRRPVFVSGAGSRIADQTLVPLKAGGRSNPPPLFGLTEMARPDETPAQFKKRLESLQENTNG